MKSRLLLIPVVVLFVAAVSGALATPRPAAPIHSADLLFPETARCGTYVSGAEASGFQISRTTFAFSQPSPLDATDGFGSAGNAVDFHWLHDVDEALTSPIIFEMKKPVSVVDAFPSIDHGPVPDEGLEFTVYGSNDPASPFPASWVAGTVTFVFDNGWNGGWIADDFVSRWAFQAGFRFVAVDWGGPGAVLSDGDAEIDAVCGVRRGVVRDKPDLTVAIDKSAAIPVSCPGGQGTCITTVNFTVTNIGTASAGSFDVLVQADPGLSQTKTVTVAAGLAAGASASFSENLGPGDNCYDPNCTVQVTVDSGNAVVESNEGNNVDTFTVEG